MVDRDPPREAIEIAACRGLGPCLVSNRISAAGLEQRRMWGMPKRGRFVAAMAIGSAAALIAALSTGLTVAGFASTGAGTAGVSFTSRSAVAELVAHYTVSPGQRPGASSRTGSGH